MMACVRGRRIEKVDALLVSVLADQGWLPLAPEPPAGGVGFRTPTLEDLRHLGWLIAYEGDSPGVFRPAAGILGYEDRYDFATGTQTWDVCYLAGSKRAIADLLRRAVEDAGAANCRVQGTFSVENMGLRRLVAKLGFPEVRVIVEAL